MLHGPLLRLSAIGTKLEGDDYWQPPTQAKQTTAVKLLKLHGSLTTITDLLKQGVPLEVVHRLAGHANPRTIGALRPATEEDHAPHRRAHLDLKGVWQNLQCQSIHLNETVYSINDGIDRSYTRTSSGGLSFDDPQVMLPPMPSFTIPSPARSSLQST